MGVVVLQFVCASARSGSGAQSRGPLAVRGPLAYLPRPQRKLNDLPPCWGALATTPSRVGWDGQERMASGSATACAAAAAAPGPSQDLRPRPEQHA
eukprot:scaffold1930_cov346-Prasinococcus_capsulatus_cf.AAC.17